MRAFKNESKSAAAQLIRACGTNDPFEIATQKNILVLFESLGEILGYFSSYKRISAIHINRDCADTVQRFICAHELGHRMLHPKTNVPFLRRNTLASIDKIEREANQFAVELLIPDELLLGGMSIYDAAAACGVPKEVAHLKTIAAEGEAKESFWRNDDSYICF